MSSLAGDAQPNEIRLARKGAAAVPVVRSSKPPYGNGRGGSRDRGKHWRRGAPPQVNAGAGPSGSRHPSQIGAIQDISKRPVPISGDLNKARKRSRSDTSSPSSITQRDEPPQTQEENYDEPQKGKSWMKRKRKQKLIGIFVEVPLDLRKEVENPAEARQRWIRQQISIVESTKNVQVMNYGFPQQNVVRFGCLPLASPKSVLPDIAPCMTETTTLASSSRRPNPVRSLDEPILRDEAKQVGPYRVPSLVRASSDISAAASGQMSTATNPIDLKYFRPSGLPLGSTRGSSFMSALRSSTEEDLIGCDLEGETDNEHTHTPDYDNFAPAPSQNFSLDLSESSQRVDNSPIARQSPSPGEVLSTASSGFSFRSGFLAITASRPRENDKSRPEISVNVDQAPSYRQTGGGSSYSVPDSCARRSSLEVIVISSDDESSPDIKTAVVDEESSPSTRDATSSAIIAGQSLVVDPSDPTRVAAPHEIAHTSVDIHDKPRRLVISPNIGIINVSLRGSIELVDGSTREVTPLLMAGGSAQHIVDDASLLKVGNSNLLAIGHARDAHPISLFEINSSSVRHITFPDRPVQPLKKGGVSAVCAMMHPSMFATGGYDHMVHLWTISETTRQTSAAPLSIKHSSLVQSLLPIRDSSHKLVTAGADCAVNLYDLSSERVVNTLRTSNSVYHVHESSSPFCTLLEVAHRELQFEIRDHRKVPQTPVQRFGYVTPKLHGRYMKGGLQHSIFACGDREGNIRLWDMRNLKGTIEMIPSPEGRKIVQVAFTETHLLALSDSHRLAFWSLADRIVT